MTRKTVGISWDDRQVQGCILRAGIAEISIERLVRIPREQAQGGTPSRSVSDDLKSLVEQLGVHDESCVTCLGESEVMYRTLLRPFSDRKKIADTIGPEVETLLPAMDSRILSDFVLAGRDRSGAHIVQVLCARSASVQNLVGDFKGAGIDPETVDCPSAAVAGGARALFSLPEEGATVVVHLGWSETSLAVLSGKTIASIGALPFGFDRIAPSAAEAGELQPGTVEGGELLNALFREILITLEKSGGLEGARFFLGTGYAGLIKDFSRRAQEALDLDIIYPTLRDIRFEGTLDDLLSGFLSASLAMRGVDTTDEVNFRQGELGLTKHMKKLRGFAGPWVKAVLALLALWIFSLTLNVVFMARTNAMLTKKLDAEFASVMPKGTPMVDPVKQMEQYLRRLSGQSGSLGGEAADSPLEILKDISAGIPASLEVTLDSINIDEGTITLSGSTANYNNVEQVQAVMAKIPYVKEVKIVSANVDKTDQLVKLKLICKK
jgi:hypothetical protein